jgi:hypothetical protein
MKPLYSSSCENSWTRILPTLLDIENIQTGGVMCGKIWYRTTVYEGANIFTSSML